jgi:hypothetical protein
LINFDGGDSLETAALTIPPREVLMLPLKCGGAVAAGLLFSAAITAFEVPTVSAQVSDPDDRPVLSLRVEGRTLVSGQQPDEIAVVYRLVNDSSKTIVAWNLGCVTARQDGRAIQGGVGYDAYVSFERYRLKNEAPPDEMIEPGKSIEHEIKYPKAVLDGPMAGQTCEPTVAIFEDATYEGPKARASLWFRSRSQAAIDSFLGRQALAGELDDSKSLSESLDLLAGKLGRSPSSSKGQSLAASRFSTYRDLLRQGLPITAEKILSDLDFHFQAAMQHLPQSWREQVLAEVGQ